MDDELKIKLRGMGWYDLGYWHEYGEHGRLCRVFEKHPEIIKNKEARWCVKACVDQDKKVRFQIDWRKTPLPVSMVNISMDLVIEFLKEVEGYGYSGDVNNWIQEEKDGDTQI